MLVTANLRSLNSPDGPDECILFAVLMRKLRLRGDGAAHREVTGDQGIRAHAAVSLCGRECAEQSAYSVCVCVYGM